MFPSEQSHAATVRHRNLPHRLPPHTNRGLAHGIPLHEVLDLETPGEDDSMPSLETITERDQMTTLDDDSDGSSSRDESEDSEVQRTAIRMLQCRKTAMKRTAQVMGTVTGRANGRRSH